MLVRLSEITVCAQRSRAVVGWLAMPLNSAVIDQMSALPGSPARKVQKLCAHLRGLLEYWSRIDVRQASASINTTGTRGQWPYRPAAKRAMRNRHVVLYDLN